jgi:phosphoribosylaminoimidazole carboxylase PurE protein
MGKKPKVGVVLGSDSDFPAFEKALELLKDFGIPFELLVASAHRSPQKVMEYAETARQRGIRVIIAGAGASAHLAGVLASYTTIPVLGVPLDSSSLKGIDALLSIIQMPAGVTVATMAIGKAGAYNASLMAAEILSLEDDELAEKLTDFKSDLSKKVEAGNLKLQKIVEERYESE